MKIKLTLALGFMGACFLVGAGSGALMMLVSFIPAVEAPREPTCITGAFVVPDETGAVWIIGDQTLCGYDLQWSAIEGPYDGMPNVTITKPVGGTEPNEGVAR